MKLLLDTHVFLWWRADSPQLPKSVEDVLLDSRNDVFVSAVAVWEICIKRELGKIVFDGSITSAIEEEGFRHLAISSLHAEEVGRLPAHHRDPFDRLLIAQARLDGLTLATVDPMIARYDGFARIGS